MIIPGRPLPGFSNVGWDRHVYSKASHSTPPHAEVMTFIDIYRQRQDTEPRQYERNILPMSTSINLSLTDELRAFIDRNCGDGTLFATPSEFLRDVLREKKERMEAAEMRDAILEGYRDLIEGRVVEFKGDLRATLKEAQHREKQHWK